MTSKAPMIAELGERAMLMPQRLEQALIANERLKLCFTLMQLAERHADHPDEALPSLQSELRTAGIAQLESLVARSQRGPDGVLLVPGVARLPLLIRADIESMLAPLQLAAMPAAAMLRDRATGLLEALPSLSDDRVPAGLIDAIASVGSRAAAAPGAAAAGDSLHLLVMDLHKAINALQGVLAQESIAGARVWNIDSADRALVEAFMSGVNETAALKFDHPGLGTTATRVGTRLVIQNDIGTTDAHVLVLQIEALTATLTVTDVHARRLEFFQSLLKPLAMQWSELLSRRTETFAEQVQYSLSIGRLQAPDAPALGRALAFLGSRIVFLIDWNRARKQLRQFLPRADTLRLLKWAADNKVGHRAFMQLGGERLLYEAIEFARRTPLQQGTRLHEILGAEAAFEYLQFVLREATAGLLQGRSERFIRDEIKAELARRFRSVNESLLGLALAHAERVFDLATAVRDGLLRYRDPGAAELFKREAGRARRWEQECDLIVSRIRGLARSTSKPEVFANLLHQSDEAADGLEEAAFLMTHLPSLSPARELLEPVQALATLVVGSAQESIKMFESGSHVSREGAREDLQDFLAAVDGITTLEHEADTAERAVTTALLTGEVSAGCFALVTSLARLLEQAADAMSLSALQLRDHLLSEMASA